MKDHPPAKKDNQEVAASQRPRLSTARKPAERGEIRGRKVGRHWRIQCQAIDAWLDEHGNRRQIGACGPRAVDK